MYGEIVTRAHYVWWQFNTHTMYGEIVTWRLAFQVQQNSVIDYRSIFVFLINELQWNFPYSRDLKKSASTDSYEKNSEFRETVWIE